MIKKIVIPSVLILYALIILLPPIIYHYTYPNGGTDTINHLRVFDQLQQGSHIAELYWGRYIIGYPIIWLSNATGLSIDTIFLWFNFSVLIGIELAVYFIISKLVNWWAGLVAVPIVVFSQSVLNMFDDGTIFELVILGIALPLFLYVVVKAVNTKKIYWILTASGIVGFVLVFHLLSAIQTASSLDTTISRITTFRLFYSSMLGLSTIGGIILLILSAMNLKEKINKKDGLAISIGLIIILIVVLSIVAFGIGKYEPLRVSYDIAIIISLLVVLLMGLIIKYGNRIVKIAIPVILVALSITYVIQYYDYNSAITPADKQAIVFARQYNSDNFSCSSEINPVIYGRYLGKEYVSNSDIYIQRNKPMTYDTTPDTLYYLGDKQPPDIILKLVADFNYGDVTVQVYDK